MPPQETLKHSKAGPAQFFVGSLGHGVCKVLFEPAERLWQVWGLILNVILPLLASCWSFSFALECGVSLFGGAQHSPVDSCSAASCSFGVQELASRVSSVARMAECPAPPTLDGLGRTLHFK